MSVGSEVRGRVGHLRLERDGALNALTVDMIRALAAGLERHAGDGDVEAIVVSSSDPRAFSAGGDMKRVRELVLGADFEPVDAFFREEYALNLAIARCPKPYVALIDGIAMGGGLGISVHGSHRVMTENARVAMPETRLGLFPDVGGTHFLPRLAHRAGWWLALAAETLGGAEAVAVGLGTHLVPAESLPALVEALETGGDEVDAAIEAHAAPVDDPDFAERLERRARWFAGDDLARIEGDLAGVAGLDEEARRLLERVRSASPFAIDATLKLFEGSLERDLEATLIREFAAVREAVRHPDFAEGVRAALVDKDGEPAWAGR